MTVVPTWCREVHPARRRALVWPREHGAWGILLVSLATGAAAGLSSTANVPPLLWLTIAVIAAFCLRTPLENSLPTSPFRPRSFMEWQWMLLVGSSYAVIGAIAGGMLLPTGALRLVWKPAAAAAGLFVFQAAVKRAGRTGRLLGEIIGAFGLAFVAIAGWAVAAGQLERQALVLWLLNGLFATNQILYVQLRIREIRGSKRDSYSRTKMFFLASEVLTGLTLIASARLGVMPTLVLLAFLPVFVRGGAWSLRTMHQPLQIHRLGKSELAHAILFGLIVIAGFRLRIP